MIVLRLGSADPSRQKVALDVSLFIVLRISQDGLELSIKQFRHERVVAESALLYLIKEIS
jgi:hypothetical protein